MIQQGSSLREGVLEASGIIGRAGYVRNVLIIFGVSIAVTYLLGGYGSPDPAMTMGWVGTLFFAFMTYLLIINSFKRLRDIRGTTDKQMLYQVVLLIALFIPVISLLVFGYLLFAKGAVTNSSSHSSVEVLPRENTTIDTHFDERQQDQML